MDLKTKWIDAIKTRGPFVINNCVFCDYPCAFSYEKDQLGYDSGCDCTYGRGGWTPIDESELDFYLHSEHGWLKKIEEFCNKK